jgi:hypothetical protein
MRKAIFAIAVLCFLAACENGTTSGGGNRTEQDWRDSLQGTWRNLNSGNIMTIRGDYLERTHISGLKTGRLEYDFPNRAIVWYAVEDGGMIFKSRALVRPDGVLVLTPLDIGQMLIANWERVE